MTRYRMRVTATSDHGQAKTFCNLKVYSWYIHRLSMCNSYILWELAIFTAACGHLLSFVKYGYIGAFHTFNG